MKNILGTIIVGCSVLLLSACDVWSGYTSVEKTLMKQCTSQLEALYGNGYSCPREYTNTDEQVMDSARTNPETKPFSQQILTFRIEDKAFKEKFPKARSINDLWYESSGELIVDDGKNRSSTDEIKKVDNKYVLSPQMYDELISAVKTCNRATISATQFTMGSTLSPEEYDNVMKIILECKKFQLEQAINQKAQ